MPCRFPASYPSLLSVRLEKKMFNTELGTVVKRIRAYRGFNAVMESFFLYLFIRDVL